MPKSTAIMSLSSMLDGFVFFKYTGMKKKVTVRYLYNEYGVDHRTRFAMSTVLGMKLLYIYAYSRRPNTNSETEILYTSQLYRFKNLQRSVKKWAGEDIQK